MTKQEEIREGIDWVLTSQVEPQYYGTNLRDRLIKKLDELGVVIKVDRELPWDEDIPKEYNELACGAEDDTDNIARQCYLLAQADMLKAGYVATIPIKEK